jgi:hypothetical protein
LAGVTAGATAGRPDPVSELGVSAAAAHAPARPDPVPNLEISPHYFSRFPSSAK